MGQRGWGSEDGAAGGAVDERRLIGIEARRDESGDATNEGV